ncbi:MAG: hypothetical protein KAJ60_03780, partial [Desulfobulbaceae bacterium]|nr:hypothetical protein [Desulfobulbaceae bacterium]
MTPDDDIQSLKRRIYELETMTRHLTNEVRLGREESEEYIRKYFEIYLRLDQKVKERTSELEEANRNLQEALTKVKTLSGFIPICASCKKIRDDKGYWNQIEAYIQKHSNAEFSHGICPECLKKLYPEFDFEDK